MKNIINYEANIDCFMMHKNMELNALYERYSSNYDGKPWITVFIPTYKRFDLFKEALASVINQKPVDFQWDILVVDNEPYEGIPNDVEAYIRTLSDINIRYFRNATNLRPGDNFNRGIYLARGEWVMMLHDDDLLLPNTLEKMGKAICFLEKQGEKPLGAIAAQYYCFLHDPEQPHGNDTMFKQVGNWVLHEPMSWRFYKLTHANVLFTGHPGGNIPSVGTTFKRDAVLEIGGFNDDFGISADLILFYCLENKFSVYSTLEPYGFYRFGINTMVKMESTYKTIKAGFDFREYVYNKSIFHKIWGWLFRDTHYYYFTKDVLNQRKVASRQFIHFSDYYSIYDKKPNKFFYKRIYKHGILSVYNKIKRWQVKHLEKKAKQQGLEREIEDYCS